MVSQAVAGFQPLTDATRLIKIPEWAQARQRDYAAFIKEEVTRWQGALRSFIFSERRMCAGALVAFEHEPEKIEQFVTQVLRLPRSSLAAVWEVLRQGRWMDADKPLPCVRRAAQRIHARDAMHNSSICTTTLLSLDAGPTGQLLPPTLHASCDPWPEQETRHDAEQRLQQQGLAVGLSPDALFIYKLRGIHGQDLSRRTLPTVLGWSTKRVERAWREVCRKKM
jgi:hypothetical protein